MDFRTFESVEKLICIFVYWVCFGLYIDVVSVSMGLNIIFCIHEHIYKYSFGCFRNFLNYRILKVVFGMVLNGSFPPPPAHPRRQQKSPARERAN